MIGLVIIAAGYAAYGPPTNHDVLDALTDRIATRVRESGEVLREIELSFEPNFPADVIIERCVRRKDRAVPTEYGGLALYGGYQCIIEVWPNGEPSYRTSGFLRHDGYQWRYYGPVAESRTPTPSQFDPFKGSDGIVTKPGSLAYDGNPQNPLNDDYDPYHALFQKPGWSQD